MSNENQIKPTLLSQIAAKTDSREPFFEEETNESLPCKGCGFPEMWCDCSRYDSEGNEL